MKGAENKKLWIENLTSLNPSFSRENDLEISVKIEFLELSYICECPTMATKITCNECKPGKVKKPIRRLDRETIRRDNERNGW